jgi:hypothetical protein
MRKIPENPQPRDISRHSVCNPTSPILYLPEITFDNFVLPVFAPIGIRSRRSG